jgi:serine/threonine protein kinase
MSAPIPPAKNTDSVPGDASEDLRAAPTQDFHPGPPRDQFTPAGVMVPGYRILGILGRGGMGVVYKAIQEKANRPVALKMILAGAHADAHDRTRFRVEAEAAARMSHPHIVQLYEVGDTPDGFPFFSLEFVGGGTLADRLKQGPLRANEAAALIETLARAIQYAHEHGIVHRDLKPLNILLDGAEGPGPADGKETMIGHSVAKTLNRPDPARPHSSTSLRYDPKALTPKISNFGLAKQLDSEDGLTRTGAIVGSPSYMAPEQAFGQSKNVGPAADIYALGAILYECLTGRPPFRGATVADTLEQVRTMEPITVRAFAREIPRDLETICLHCLHKDPQRRYASAAALADDLRRFGEGQSISVRPVGKFERTWRWCKRHPGSSAAIGSLIALVLVVIGGLIWINVETTALNARILQESARAKKRQQESMLALGIFTYEAREFTENALIPSERTMKLYAKVVHELEKQVDADADADADADTIDSLRTNAYLFTVLGIAENEMVHSEKAASIHVDKARAWTDRALKAVDQWLVLAPDDPDALSRRAELLQLMGATRYHAISSDADKKSAAGYFAEALAIRRKLAADPEAVRVIDQVAPGKLKSDLVGSLENANAFAEAFQVHDEICRERPHPAYLDNRAYCYVKAASITNDYARKKDYLLKADQKYTELNALMQKSGQVNRHTALRWSSAIQELIHLEKAHQNAAEVQKHLEKLAMVRNMLAVSNELRVDQIRHAQVLGELARMQLAAGQHAKARASAEAARTRLEQVLSDYQDEGTPNVQIDLCRLHIELGEPGKAIRGADFLRTKHPDDKSQSSLSYRLACVYSLCIPAIAQARGKSPLTQDDQKLQAVCRDQALQCIGDAFQHGFDGFAHVRTDADLAPIRDDPRFEAILVKHEKK